MLFWVIHCIVDFHIYKYITLLRSFKEKQTLLYKSG